MSEHLNDKAICAAAELEDGRLTEGRVGRLPVVATLSGGKPVAFAARCPHQGADLGAGCIVDHVDADAEGCLIADPTRPILRCPWHGFEFDLMTGEAVVAPPEHLRLRLRQIPVRVVDGQVVPA